MTLWVRINYFWGMNIISLKALTNIGGVIVKDREKFMGNWTPQRQKGRLKYVLIQAGQVACYGLAGVVIGSAILYNSPSTYSLAYYLPTYFFVFLVMYLAAILKFTYQWSRNEEKYSQLSDKR